MPLDRQWALTNGSWTFDAGSYAPRPKTDFIALMDHAALASLATRYDDAGNCLHVSAPDGRHLRIDVDGLNDADTIAKIRALKPKAVFSASTGMLRRPLLEACACPVVNNNAWRSPGRWPWNPR